MFKVSVVILIASWLSLAGILGVNIYQQYRVNRLQMRILNDYKQMSELPAFFKTVQDSLYADAKAAEKLAIQITQPFPLRNTKSNWLMMRLGIILLTVLSIAAFWVYYKKHQPQ